MRCKWCNEKNPLYVKYHDEEWGILRTDDQYLYEMLILEGFQAGLSWECVLNKREAFREAFDDFDIDNICSYDEAKIDSLCQNKDIIRNKLKIKAAISNSKIFKSIVKDMGSFYDYLCKFTEGKIFYEYDRISSPLSDSISADLIKKGMKFCGSVIIYSYLQAVGIINSHEKNCFLHGETDKNRVIDFFNNKASLWDSMAIECPDKIREILRKADVGEGKSVLDIACGTGVLVPFYIEKNIKNLLCTDISPEMLKIASNKFGNNPKIDFLCADAEEAIFPQKYDCAVIFDAFPHFGNPLKLIKNVSRALKPDGRLTIAHSMGAEQLDKLHKKAAPGVSRKLIPAQELAELLSLSFNVDTIISDNDIYIVSAILK